MVEDEGAELAEVLRGSATAWQCFFGRHAGVVDQIIRASRSMGSFARCDDECRNVMARVFERLRRDDFRALRSFGRWQERYPDKRFADWLVIVTTNVIRDYVVERLGPERPDGHGAKLVLDAWLCQLPDEDAALAVLPHATTRETARQLVELARATLPPDQLACLAAWLEGCDFDEIARRQALPEPRAAEKRVRAALARLRRQVGG